MDTIRGKASPSQRKPYARSLEAIPDEQVGDGSILRQIFHPSHHPVQIGYSFSWACLKPGSSTRRHVLAQSETYFILSGEGTLVLDGKDYPMKAGRACWIPPRCWQFLRNEGRDELEFLVIVDPPWTEEGDSAEEKGKRDRSLAADLSRGAE